MSGKPRRLTRLAGVLFLDGFRAAPGWMSLVTAMLVLGSISSTCYPLGYRLLVDGALGGSISQVILGVLVVGGLIAREIPVVAELITRLLHYTDQGSWRLTMAVALLAAVGEELFYRGALYTALARHHPLLISTVIYAIATLASSRNPMLAFAAIILGTVCALERRATGGVLAPILTHFVWTLVVLLALPPLFGL